MRSNRVTLQSAAVATGNGTAIDVSNYDVMGVQVAGITSATITWETSIDGTNWVGILVAPVTTGTGALTTTADGLFALDVSGLALIRARISTWVSGTITVTALLRGMGV
jgi:hypothetical protein